MQFWGSNWDWPLAKQAIYSIKISPVVVVFLEKKLLHRNWSSQMGHFLIMVHPYDFQFRKQCPWHIFEAYTWWIHSLYWSFWAEIWRKWYLTPSSPQFSNWTKCLIWKVALNQPVFTQGNSSNGHKMFICLLFRVANKQHGSTCFKWLSSNKIKVDYLSKKDARTPNLWR